jgi:hypothetical protein
VEWAPARQRKASAGGQTIEVLGIECSCHGIG